MRREEFLGLRPQRRHALRCVVQIDRESVGFVAVLHVSKDVVVDVTEETDLRFHTPVIPIVGEGRVLVEHATVPSTHLVV